MPSDARNGVLLSGYYGCGNLGDDLLLTVTIDGLRAIMPDARFLVRDHGETASLPDLGPNVVFTGLDAVLSDQSRPRYRRLATFVRRLAALLRQCRWLVFGGGTVFHDNTGVASLAVQWLMCVVARALGVRIAALGVGVGDLRTATGRWLLRSIVAHSDLFLVRDDAALRQCAGTKARLTADLVFAWKGLTSEKAQTRSHAEQLCVGLTVSPSAVGPTVAALADAIRHWQERGHRVVFLVLQQSRSMADDRTVFADLHSKIGAAAASIDVRRLTADAAVIDKAFADIDVICGMRFHGLVLAAMLGRPFVGIAHDNKISEICRRFAMPCVDLANLSGVDLARSVEDIRGRAPERQLVEESREAAQDNFRAFAALAP